MNGILCSSWLVVYMVVPVFAYTWLFGSYELFAFWMRNAPAKYWRVIVWVFWPIFVTYIIVFIRVEKFRKGIKK